MRMSTPIKKCIVCVLLLCLMLAGFAAVLTRQGISILGSHRSRDILQKMDGLANLVSASDTRLLDAIDTLFEEKLEVNIELTALALRLAAEDGCSLENFRTEDGAVLRVKNGKLFYPEGFRPDALPLPERFWERPEESTIFTNYRPEPDAPEEPVLVFWEPVTSDSIYVDWTAEEEITRSLEAENHFGDILDWAEDIYGGKIIVLWEKDGELAFFSNSTEYETRYTMPAELGITRELIEAGEGLLEIEGQEYLCAFRPVPSQEEGRELTLAFLTARDPKGLHPRALALALTLITLPILLPLIIWLTSLQQEDHAISEDGRWRSHHPYAVRRFTAASGLLGTLVMFLAGAFLCMLFNLYETSVTDRRSVSAIKTAVESREKWLGWSESEEDTWREYYACRIARLLESFPSLQRPEVLEQFSDLIGSEFIMAFDTKGEEIMGSGPYRHFRLDAEDDELLRDFMRLTKGVPSIVHKPAQDKTTGLYCQQVGANLQLENGDYGALLFFFPADPETEDKLRETGNLLVSLFTPPFHLNFVVDQKSPEILLASEEISIPVGSDAHRIIHDDVISQGFNYFRINNNPYYGAFTESPELSCFYLSPAALIGESSMRYAAVTAGLFFLMYAVVAAVMLWGYTPELYQRIFGEGQQKGCAPLFEEDDEAAALPRFTPALRRGISHWQSRTPEAKALLSFQLVLGLIALTGVLLYLSRRDSEGFSIIRFLLYGEWTRGFNYFAFSSILLLWSMLSIGMIFLRFLVRVLSEALGSKGETLLRLLLNLAEYAAAITALCFSLILLGINIAPLIGVMGILSLAFSLGSQNLVQDVLAGITIVFEREYQVGDVVQINDFKGQVLEIGVRSTKLLGLGNNVKIIGNRNVNEVLNMTRMNSWYVMKLRIPGDQPLETVETMLQRELPKLEGKIRHVISGPFYRGVVNLGEGGIPGGKNAYDLTIIAEYREENYLKVQRNLNRAIKELFTKEGINYF